MVASMLALVGLAFVPQAAAEIPHPCEDKPVENTCYTVVGIVLDAVGDVGVYANCYYTTPPRDWQAVCM